MKLNPLALVIYVYFAASSIRAANYSVAEFGARGDGRAIDTTAIQNAIDAAANHHGTVTFPSGRYLTGALFLKSGVHFQVNRGVTLLGIQAPDAYPELPTRVAGIEMKWPAALLNVYEQSDVEISGEGTIDGQGNYWWDRYWSLRKEYEPKGLRWASDYDARRVRLVQIYKSSHVSIHGLTFERSGFWTVHLCYSSKIAVEGLTIRNNIGGRGPSTDGIDVDSSSHVTISKCDISCNDDAICMKAGRDADGLRVNRPTEHVRVQDCIVRAGAAGITFGSETSGSIRDVYVSDLHVLAEVPKGICFKSAAVRGGTVENIRIRHLDLQGVAVPISIALNWNPNYSYARIPAGMTNIPEYWKVLATRVPPEKGIPHVRNIEISNVHASGAKRALEVDAFPTAPVRKVTLDRLEIEAATAGSIKNVENWTLKNSHIRTADGSELALK